VSRTPRIIIGALSLSAAGLVGLATRENYVEQAAVPVKGDVPTLGFGSTTHLDGSPVRLGDRTTPVKALQRTLAYTAQAEADIKKCIDVPLHQGEFDLYMDFAYQYGVPTFCASAVAAHLRAQRYAQACDALLSYRFMSDSRPHEGWTVSKRNAAGQPVRWQFDCAQPGNKVCLGVWTRQQARHSRCMELQS
jgi:lysozyme